MYDYSLNKEDVTNMKNMNHIELIGEIEGNLGAIRLFGVLKQYQGLCIGHRLLKRVESIMFKEVDITP
jgi:GNAT superfamily N-acetyltransferase